MNGAIAGVLIGTIGLAAEWAWSHIWMPIPWNDSLLPEAAIAGILTAVAAGAVGGFIGGSLVGRSGALISREDGRRLGSADRRAALVAGLALMAVIGWALPMSDRRARAGAGRAEGHRVAAPQRTVEATIRLDPRDSVDDPEFMNVTGWQGGGSVIDPLEQVGRGRLPDHQADPGLRRLEVDAADPAGRRARLDAAVHAARRGHPGEGGPGGGQLHAGVPADIEVLQRERKQDVSGALTLAAYLTVLAIALSLIALIAWSLAARRPRRGPAAAGGQDRPAARRTRVEQH